MKKLLVTMLVLAFASLAIAQEPAGAGAQQSPTAQAGEQAGQQKPKPPEIKDPAEYNAYVSSVQNPNVQQKISGLEDFLTRYPNSVVKKEALEELMGAYQQAGQPAKVLESAQKLLQVDPNSVRALVLLAYTARMSAASATTAQILQDQSAQAGHYGRQGLQAVGTMAKPEGMTDADFQKFKEQSQIILNGAAGFAALQSKSYPEAQNYFNAAEELRSKSATPVNAQQDPLLGLDAYGLALAYLEPKPINPIGLWWIARAANLYSFSAPAQKQMADYGRRKYAIHHGSEEGWDQVLQEAAASPLPPADFAVKPAPTLPEQAQILANSKAAKEMSIAEWELILQYGDQATRDKVWAQIQQLPSIAFQGKVVDADKTTVSLAATEDAITANKADVVVTMVAAMPVKDIPKAGAQIPIQGKAASYTQSPFVLQLSNGMLIEQKKPAPKPAPRRRRR